MISFLLYLNISATRFSFFFFLLFILPISYPPLCRSLRLLSFTAAFSAPRLTSLCPRMSIAHRNLFLSLLFSPSLSLSISHLRLSPDLSRALPLSFFFSPPLHRPPATHILFLSSVLYICMLKPTKESKRKRDLLRAFIFTNERVSTTPYSLRLFHITIFFVSPFFFIFNITFSILPQSKKNYVYSCPFFSFIH